MCDAVNEQAISDIVDEFVQKEKCFTAFDATQEGERRGTTTERHGLLKGSVHAQFNRIQSQSYTRTLVNTASGDAWLYHPVGADITAEVARLSNNQSHSLPSPNLPSPNDDDDDGILPSPNFSTQQIINQSNTSVLGAKTSIKRATNSEGRLQIPKELLEQADITKEAAIEQVGGKLVVSRRTYPDTPGTTLYQLNTDGRIRLGPKALNRLPSNSGAFKMTVVGNKIEILPLT